MFDKVYLIKSISAVTNHNSSSCLQRKKEYYNKFNIKEPWFLHCWKINPKMKAYSEIWQFTYKGYDQSVHSPKFYLLSLVKKNWKLLNIGSKFLFTLKVRLEYVSIASWMIMSLSALLSFFIIVFVLSFKERPTKKNRHWSLDPHVSL